MKFPDQLIDESKKTLEWGSLHADYGQELLRNSSNLRDQMNGVYQSYNGIKPPSSIAYLTRRFGKADRAKYISYRAHKTKIKLMIGEFLSQPIAGTVETINRDAKSEKMKQMDFWKGAMVAKPELEELKSKVGVDVTEGAPIPENDEDPLWDIMSPKDKDENIMQIILNEQIPELDFKQKVSEGVEACAITSEIHGMIRRDDEGETQFINIDPRDAIYEEIKGDTFCEKSPIRGHREWMAIHDIFRIYRLSEKQTKLLKEISDNPSSYSTRCGSSMKMSNGGLVLEVMHLEWKSLKPYRSKKMPKTASQMAFDSTEEYITQDLDNEKYEKGREYYDKEEKKGNLKVETKYAETLYEITRIAGLRELDINFREAYFQMRRVDDPTRIFSGSYTSYLCNTVDGLRISLFKEMENWSNIFDITMYKILKDINRAQGRAIGFNKAALGKDDTVDGVMYDIVNDGFMSYNTAAAGNAHGKEVTLNKIIEQLDLGLSDSFPSLVAFKNDILAMMDRMTGINENREGQISASATATNTNSAIQASRTITLPFFYGINLFISKTLVKIIESTKVTWAFYKIEKGEQILGSGKWKYLQATQSIGFKDYGFHLQDGGKYKELTQKMSMLMEASLNAKEMRPEDALQFMLSETFAEQTAVLKNSWAKIKEVESQNQQANMQNQQQMQQAQFQQQIELAREDREDRQQDAKDNIILKGDTDIRVNAAQASNKVVENEHKFRNDDEFGSDDLNNSNY